MTGPLLVATGNPGKLREFRAAFEAEGLTVVGLNALSDIPDVEETGDSFEANARIKAEAYSAHTELWTVAEDSGIEVDALDGAPGVRSARYGGPGLDDRGRLELLLERMRDVPDPERTARYRAVLAVARRGAQHASFSGSVEGRLTREPVGDRGFGYDPIFFHPPIGKTFAQISREQKQELSHRGAAIAAMLGALRDGSLVLT